MASKINLADLKKQLGKYYPETPLERVKTESLLYFVSRTPKKVREEESELYR